MKLLTLLFLIFLNACGIVHIEIRDRSDYQRAPTKAQETSQQKREPAKREEEQRGRRPLQETQAYSHRQTKTNQTQENKLSVSSPVKGRVSATDRGYYIHTPCGEFFRSVSDGKILYSGDDIKGYGWVVMVDGEDGLVYVYGRAESVLVKRGERVKRGQPLGRVGKTQDGCGLLFELRNAEGKPVSFELML
ncbi:MAG: M23 family metallopeptidase [Aquificaceae bacterium]|nr:M23 family metallopeptidase [Aquificaceae bacterium]